MKKLVLLFLMIIALPQYQAYSWVDFLGPMFKKHKEDVQKDSKKAEEDDLKTSTQCAKLIAYFEKKYNIPEHLLQAIAIIESKKSPWAVYGRNKSKIFKTKDAALKHIHELKKLGTNNINVGCMQIDVKSHGKRFDNMEKMIIPYHNIEFAAKLLKKLHHHYGSWEKAVRYYHSACPDYHIPYQNRVFIKWAKAKKMDCTLKEPNSQEKKSRKSLSYGVKLGIKRK